MQNLKTIRYKLDQIRKEKILIESVLGITALGGGYLLYKRSLWVFSSIFFGSLSLWWLKHLAVETAALKEEERRAFASNSKESM